MKDRIRQIMEEQHLTQQSFAQMLGIAPASLCNIFNDRTKPTLNIVEAIKKKFPMISSDWLLFGIPPMYKKEATEGVAKDASTSDGTPTPSSVEGLAINFEDANQEGAAESSSASRASAAQQADASRVNSGNLFDQPQDSCVKDTLKNRPKEIVKYIDKPQRKITEIRVFYDDQTWETFVPKN